MALHSLTLFIYILITHYPSTCFKLNHKFGKSSFFESIYACELYALKKMTQSTMIETKSIREGSIIEYISAKGLRRVALVNTKEGGLVKVVNEARKLFKVPFSRLTYHIEGKYAFGDLLRLEELLQELKLPMVEAIWHACLNDKKNLVSFNEISEIIWETSDPIHIFAGARLMSTFGSIYFSKISTGTVVYTPLPMNTVQSNLRDRATLKELKMKYNHRLIQAPKNSKSSPVTILHEPTASHDDGKQTTISEEIEDEKEWDENLGAVDLSQRALQAISNYENGLKQLVAESHPWMKEGIAKLILVESEVQKARELLDYLELAPTARNARKILEMIGRLAPHTNMEKYIMKIRDEFPVGVITEAKDLMENHLNLPDPDERIRRDLTYLNSYSIDRDGAQEIDDAISIERLDNGDEKVWIHISDVSRYVRPGSELSMEAERRMATLYLPDERITMFPEALTSELLSLGACPESYALSCGVVFDDVGSVVSCEVCPSKIKLTKKLGFSLLDQILLQSEIGPEGEAAGLGVGSTWKQREGGEGEGGEDAVGVMSGKC